MQKKSVIIYTVLLSVFAVLPVFCTVSEQHSLAKEPNSLAKEQHNTDNALHSPVKKQHRTDNA